MESNNIFHPKRFLLLLREELFFGKRLSLLVAGAAALLMIIVYVINMLEGSGMEHFYQSWFSTFLFGGGLLFTSVMFNNLINKPSRQFYLSLPASTLEKFTTKWLVSAIIFPVALVIGYQIIAWILDAVSSSYELKGADSFNPFSEENVLLLQVYFVIQTIFLLGAVSFRKYAIFKTMFTFLIVGVILGVVLFLCVRIIFAEYWDGLLSVTPEGPRPNDAFIDWMKGPFTNTMLDLFWWVLAPITLFIGFLKLKEKEV